jgi:TorA maturation chaperone TorD
MSAGVEKHQTAMHAAQDQLRAGVWNLLGNLLAAAPTEETLGLLRQIDEQKEGASDPMAQAWSTLRLAAENAVAARVEEEYQDVFIGVGGGEVTPYASWYLTGSLFEQPLIALRQELESLGIEREEGVSEPEDHAGAVCGMMALVIMDPDVDFQWQREFFQRHVEQWLGRLFTDLQKAPSAAFYRAVGGVGEEFHKLEQHYFSVLG